MSMSVVERFWVRVATDTEYQAQFRGALPEHPTPEALAQFASGTGYEVCAEHFLEHARTLTVSANTSEAERDVELSDDMLEAVAGGGSEDSYASAPLEMDIYATWDGVDAAPAKGPLAGGTAAPRPPAP